MQKAMLNKLQFI